MAVETREVKINKWGGSLAIRFPNDFVEAANLKEKSLVEIRMDGDELILKVKSSKPPKYTLKELFEMYPSDYAKEDELDWGEPVGDEAW
ncbi:MAG: AbrB/MazE/SpoVT family DNA-binding domain-containing protein [Defluviitaleaceae bacterium]|nr:AbrB/MazE/SpoVT family DNA-binding domain-containing protein [Defluviitaleaceae bacterium]